MLLKFGSQLKITAASTTLEDIVVEKENTPETKILENKQSDFLYFRARAISALETSGPNGNGDSFPKKELEAAYESFIGKNLFLNHESDNPIKSVGKIIDAILIEDPETKETYVETISKIDRKIHPEIARKVETGELNTVSMGCSCSASMCSICGTTVNSDLDEKCEHLSPQGLLKEYMAEIDMPEYGIKKGTKTKAHSINSGLGFNELSIVNVPADSKAVIKTIISNLRNQLVKTASLNKEQQLDLVANIEQILSQLDEKTRETVKAEMCACEPSKEAVQMSDKKEPVDPNLEMKDILTKLNAYDYTRLVNHVSKKEAKISKEPEVKEVKASTEVVAKDEESTVKRIMEKVMSSLAGKLFAHNVKRVAEEELNKEALTPADEGSRAAKLDDEHRAGLHKDKKVEHCYNCQNEPKKEEDLNPKTAEETFVCSKCGDREREGLRSRDGKDLCEQCELEKSTPTNEHKLRYSTKFNKHDDLNKSSWQIMEDDKVVLEATLDTIWEDELEANKDWGTSEEYGKELLAHYEKEGSDKTLDLLGLNKEAAGICQDCKQNKNDVKKYFGGPNMTTTEMLCKDCAQKGMSVKAVKVMDVKDSKVEKPTKSEFVKPSTETKADKEVKKTDKALDKVDDKAAVGDHLEDSKPEEDQKKDKKAGKEDNCFVCHKPVDMLSKKDANTTDNGELYHTSCKATWETVHPGKDIDRRGREKMLDEASVNVQASAFDKVEKIMLEQDHTAIKDKETGEIVVTDKEGKEVKRLPDGFGDDIPTVMKLLHVVLGIPEKPEEELPKVDEAPMEEPKIEEPVKEELPEAPKEEVMDDLTSKKEEEDKKTASKLEELNKKAAELQKKEEELKKIESNLKAQKFSSILNARTERCKQIIAEMVDKEMLEVSDEDVDTFVTEGSDLLAAKKKAFEKAVNKQIRTLLSMDDVSLTAFAESIGRIKIRASQVLSKTFHLSLPPDRGFDQEVETIFNSMGNGKK